MGVSLHGDLRRERALPALPLVLEAVAPFLFEVLRVWVLLEAVRAVR